MKRALLALAVAAGCQRNPEPPPPRWSPVFSELPAPLFSAWQASDGVIYAVGGTSSRSLVLRHDENGWWEMEAGTTAALWWVFGFSSSHVYAAGEHGTITWFNGQQWEVQRQGGDYTLYGLWGTSPRELWAVGGSPNLTHAAPIVLRSDGEQWSSVPSGLSRPDALFKIWGASADDVWVTGDHGLLARRDGGTFALETQPAAARLVTVFGAGARDVWAVGGTSVPALVHFDGASWSDVALPEGSGLPLLGGAERRGEVLVVGTEGYAARGTGTQLALEDLRSNDSFHAAAATSGGFVAVGGDLLGAGARGAMLSDYGLAGGPLQPWPNPGRPLPEADAGAPLTDAGTRSDAGVVLAPGAFCEGRPAACAAPDECWLIVGPDRAICTRECQLASDCGAFGSGACCIRPGPQVTLMTCLPRGLGDCP